MQRGKAPCGEAAGKGCEQPGKRPRAQTLGGVGPVVYNPPLPSRSTLKHHYSKHSKVLEKLRNIIDFRG